jgi:hypothetical protein
MDKPIEPLTPSRIIDRLGGTTAVAALCQVRSPSVSEWRRVKVGIPASRRLYLELLNPQAFDPSVPDDAVPVTTAPAVKNAA